MEHWENLVFIGVVALAGWLWYSNSKAKKAAAATAASAAAAPTAGSDPYLTQAEAAIATESL